MAKPDHSLDPLILASARRELTTVDMSEAEIHILLTAFWATIYEPFIHGYNLEQLESHCKLVCKLFDWYRVFGFPSP